MFARMDILPHGAFWTRPTFIGLTEEEVEANEKHALTKERADQIAFTMRIAASGLYQLEPKGTC